MPDKTHQAVEHKMQALRARYIAQLGERAAQLEQMLAQRSTGLWHEAEHLALKALAHKLAGTGATYGYPAISETGHALEDALMEPAPDAAREIPLIRALLAACEDARHTGALPLHSNESEQSAASDTRPPNPLLPLLLVVDDDENVRAMLQELFARDAEILTATNSQDALALMQSRRPDLVLLDDNMPEGVSGLRMLEAIRAMPDIAKIPVVMITASDRPEEIMQGLMAGAVDYITKPFVPAAISEKIKLRLQRLSRHVLIVDDDESVRELLAHKFRHAGCKVSLAVDGIEAWKFLLKNSVSLALLDRMMPGMDGLALLRMMKETKSLAHIPVVFLTARHYTNNVLEGLHTGAEDYITKPFNPDEVVARCMRLLQQSIAAVA